MNGGSLGLRSGSYGSLQQQLQNGAALPTQSPPLPVRKTSKMSLSGSRDKEKILPRIFKFAGRRKVGMLLLLVASAAVLSFISAVTKGLAFLLFFLIYKLSHALRLIIVWRSYRHISEFGWDQHLLIHRTLLNISKLQWHDYLNVLVFCTWRLPFLFRSRVSVAFAMFFLEAIVVDLSDLDLQAYYLSIGLTWLFSHWYVQELAWCKPSRNTTMVIELIVSNFVICCWYQL